MTKLDQQERDLLESVDRGEWQSIARLKKEQKRYQEYAKATFKKDRRVNIRISTKDLEAIQKRAIEEGVPYQTLIASRRHIHPSKLRWREDRELGDVSLLLCSGVPEEGERQDHQHARGTEQGI